MSKLFIEMILSDFDEDSLELCNTFTLYVQA